MPGANHGGASLTPLQRGVRVRWRLTPRTRASGYYQAAQTTLAMIKRQQNTRRRPPQWSIPVIQQEQAGALILVYNELSTYNCSGASVCRRRAGKAGGLFCTEMFYIHMDDEARRGRAG